MNLLIDTHALLWFIGKETALSSVARAVLEDEDNAVFVSVATIWEMAIKVSLGKIRLKLRIERELPEFLEANAFDLLPIDYEHAARVAALPVHHGDPFDRLLIAQSLIECLPLVSRDQQFEAYGVKRIW